MGRPKKAAHSSSKLKPKTKPKINDREPHLRPAFLVVWYEGEEKRGKFFDNENAAHCYRVSKIVDSVAADNAHESHQEADMALDLLKQVMLYGSGNDGAGKHRDEIFVSPVIDPKEAAALQREEFAKEDKEFNERVESGEQRKINETRELLKSDLGVRLGSGLEALLEQKPPPPPDVVYAYAKTGEVPGPDWTWDQCAVWEAVREEFSTMNFLEKKLWTDDPKRAYMVHVVGRQTQEDGSVSVPLDPETIEILKEQEKRFKEKFGRDMGPNDPIWFDPDCDTPTPIDDDKLREGTVEVLKKAGLRPELLYAYEKTGLIVASEYIYNHRLSPEDRADYDAAIDEYFAMNPREDDKE